MWVCTVGKALTLTLTPTLHQMQTHEPSSALFFYFFIFLEGEPTISESISESISHHTLDILLEKQMAKVNRDPSLGLDPQPR